MSRSLGADKCPVCNTQLLGMASMSAATIPFSSIANFSGMVKTYFVLKVPPLSFAKIIGFILRIGKGMPLGLPTLFAI